MSSYRSGFMAILGKWLLNVNVKYCFCIHSAASNNYPVVILYGSQICQSNKAE